MPVPTRMPLSAVKVFTNIFSPLIIWVPVVKTTLQLSSIEQSNSEPCPLTTIALLPDVVTERVPAATISKSPSKVFNVLTPVSAQPG